MSCGRPSPIRAASVRELVSDESANYAWKLLAPFGLVSLAAPLLLLLGAPQAFLNLITNVPWTKTITFHYAALPFAAVTIAAVEGVAFLAPPHPVARRRGHDRGGRARVLGRSRPSRGGRRRSVPSTATASGHSIALPELPSARRAVADDPDDAAVSATYNLVPHLTHRAEIYSLPNPWHVDELRDRRRAAAQRQAGRVDRRRPTTCSTQRTREVAAGLRRPRDVPRGVREGQLPACSGARSPEPAHCGQATASINPRSPSFRR